MSRSPLILPLLALLTACGGGIQGPKLEEPDTGGVEGPPNLFVETEFVDFGEVELQQVETYNLTVRNTGAGDLEITETSFSDTVFGTSGIPSIIPAGGNAVVNLTFLPTDYGVYDGTLTILSNDAEDSAFEIQLRGRVISDADDDGYDSIAAGGDDCDDEDPEVNPGAEDLWYDGKDTNCDGADDYDQDGDGFQTDIYNPDPDGGGGDCQDSNADIYPGAEDAWYDGVDSDCDGANDYDVDGDGWMHPSGGGTDCDDTDANLNPDATERFNGADDNCDGTIDGEINAWDADLTYTGDIDSDRFGSAVTIGDLDSDGHDDLVVGAYSYSTGRGGVAIFDGSSMPADGSTIADAANTFLGDGSADSLGFYVGWFDAYGSTSDGHLAVGAPGTNGNYGALYMIPGGLARTGGDTADAVTVITGSSSAYYVGRGAAADLDLDGDGLHDIFGYYQTSSSSSSATSYQYLLYGDAVGSFGVGDTDARFYSPGNANIVWRNVPSGGDLNGDGYADALWCDHFADLGSTNNGGVYGLWGGTTRYDNSSAQSLATAGTMLSQGDERERHGWQCAIGDDLDGDGDDELWIFNPGRGTIYVVAGGAEMETGDIDAEADAMHYYSVSASGPWPDGLRSIGDWDGDGISEMSAGLRTAPNASNSGGKVWVFSSQDAPGEHNAAEIYASISGDIEQGNQLVGAKIPSGMGDFNADGLLDFVVTDYGWDELDSSGATISSNPGAVYISYGR